MEIDGDPDDMDRVKKMEALATSKLEKISQDLKVIGRLAFRIDDILYCLKHCRYKHQGMSLFTNVVLQVKRIFLLPCPSVGRSRTRAARSRSCGGTSLNLVMTSESDSSAIYPPYP